jgi:hypothetical protein
MTAVRRRCLDTGVTTAQENIAVSDLRLRAAPAQSAARPLARPADPAATAPQAV